MSEYTPTPWMAASKHSSVVGVPVVAQNGQHICNTSMPGLPEDWPEHRRLRSVANAAFIVKAVNSYEANETKIKALVKALRECVQDIIFCERAKAPSFNPRSLGVGTVLGDAIATLDAIDGVAIPSQDREVQS